MQIVKIQNPFNLAQSEVFIAWKLKQPLTALLESTK